MPINQQISSYLKEMREVVDKALALHLPVSDEYPKNLIKSMHYSVFAGGKRLRPILVLAAAESVNGPVKRIIPFSLGVELIHTYTLIHDDLPALDNDDFRRGKPTNHKAFGDTTAILAGDALQTYAFQLMTETELIKWIPPEVVLRAVNEFAKAVGPLGTIGGQMVDIESEDNDCDVSTLEYIHTHKTGYLIRACIRSGGILSQCSEKDLEALTQFGENIGLAFQIIDDILDVTGDQKEIGKDAKSDIKSKKTTYPSLFGIEESQKKAQKLIDNGIEYLDSFNSKADYLRGIASYFISRTH